MTRVSCHCQAVELDVTLAEPLSNARRCDCSFCAKRAAPVVFVNIGDLTVTKGTDALTCYQWNTHQEEHFFCKICGVYTHHRHADPTAGYAVNLMGIDGVNPRDHSNIGWIDGKTYQPADYPKGAK